LQKIFKALEISALILIILIFIFPFLWMISTSLKTLQETTDISLTLLPKHLMFSNYLEAWNSIPFAAYLKNSLIVTFSILIIQFFLIVPAAYGFARYNFQGKRILFP
jgi:sn-glycerol 3-phosphate transport system permease protein